MFDRDGKIIERIAPMLQRVLVIDPHTANARMLGELIRSVLRCQVWAAPATDKGLKLAKVVEPDIIFIELAADGLDGLEFTGRLRRSTLSCRQAPVIMITGEVKAAAILAARDAGVHEFLRKPFTCKALLRRLEAVTLRPRDWIEAVDYVGPDRRRFNSGDYRGALKRRSDTPPMPDAARMSQALKIVRSAIAAVDRDPVQALRALQAQAKDLQKAAVKAADMKLTTAVIEFSRYLTEIEQTEAINASELEHRAAPLLSYLPKDETAAAA